MTRERHKQIGDLYHLALELEPARRAAFLDRACVGDEQLRREVEALLDSDEEAESFLASPAIELAARHLAEEQPLAKIGSEIGTYQILSLLGAGGMGEVYLAEDTRLDRKVALKLLPEAFTRQDDRLRRFVREAKAASALNHPNIITIHEIGETDGSHYIATEYIEGETLRELLHRRKMTIIEALDVAIQTASALAAAHQAGIVHRDIKPENIMLRLDGYVKVLDFGLAKLTEQKPRASDSAAPTIARIDTDPGTILGTANYMSPEQAQGRAVDARADIFSLGAVIYEMAAGRPPFEGESPGAIIASILKTEPAPLARFEPEAPSELQRIVSKALRKDREERYQTTKDLLIDLKSLREDLAFQLRLERSVGPESSGSTTIESGGAAAVATATNVAAQTGEVPIRTTSSAEYIATEIKRHKVGALVSLVVLALAIAGLIVYNKFLKQPQPSKHTETVTQIRSLAVLPFKPLAANTRDESLEMGMADTLITRLSSLRQIIVRPMSAVRRYAGLEQDSLAAGQEQRVDAVLDGSIQKSGERVRVTVRLMSATDGQQLWADKFEEKFTDIFSVQDSISERVAELLEVKLTGEEQKQLTKRYTQSTEAYQLYLKGRYFWNKRSADGIRKAIEQFQQAIDHDPNYALGYVGLADCYVLLELYAGIPTSETLPKARTAADRALQIDDSLPEAHTSSAHVYQKLWRWVEAEKEYRRAISLNPNYATAHHWFAIYFERKGQFDDALGEARRAQELDHLSPIFNEEIAFIYLQKNDLNSAIEQFRIVFELDPNFSEARRDLGFAYLKQRRYEEAATEFQKAVKASAKASRYLSALGYCYAVMGRHAEAVQILKELEEKYNKKESIGQYLASVYAGLADKDKAFAWLERDYQQRSGELPTITLRGPFETLSEDSRYVDLVRLMGLNP